MIRSFTLDDVVVGMEINPKVAHLNQAQSLQYTYLEPIQKLVLVCISNYGELKTIQDYVSVMPIKHLTMLSSILKSVVQPSQSEFDAMVQSSFVSSSTEDEEDS